MISFLSSNTSACSITEDRIGMYFCAPPPLAESLQYATIESPLPVLARALSGTTMSSASSSSSNTSSSDSEDTVPHNDPRALNEDESDSETSSSSSSSDSEGPDSASEQEEDEEAPVLSHKEQRKQKKKELKQQNADAATLSEKQKGKQPVKNSAELAPSKLPQRQNSVWVGNLAFKTTPDALRRFFDGVGEITRIHMPMKMASGGPGGGGARKENRG